MVGARHNSKGGNLDTGNGRGQIKIARVGTWTLVIGRDQNNSNGGNLDTENGRGQTKIARVGTWTLVIVRGQKK